MTAAPAVAYTSKFIGQLYLQLDCFAKSDRLFFMVPLETAVACGVIKNIRCRNITIKLIQ